MSQKTETAKQPMGRFDPFVAFNTLSPAAWMGTAWFARMGDLSREVTSFVAERIKEDVQTQQALLHCKSLSDVQKLQAEFLQKAFDQYQAETGKLVEMAGLTALGDPDKDRTGV